MQAKRFLTAKQRWGLVGAVMGLVSLMSLIAVSAANDPTPVVTIPSVPMPHPNGFDLIVKAENALVKPDEVWDAYRTAQPNALAKNEALVKENAVALQLVRASFAYPTIVPQPRSEDPLFKYGTQVLPLAELLALQARVRAAHGDWNGAASSAVDAIKLGENLPQAGCRIDWLIGLSCQTMGQKPLWEIVPYLNEAQARAAATRLELLDKSTTPLADVMQREKWMLQASLLATFQHQDWRTSMTTDTFLDGGVRDDLSARVHRIAFHMQLEKLSKKNVFDTRTRFLDAVIRSARAPYSSPVPIPDLPLDPQHALMDSLIGVKEAGIPRPLGAIKGAQTLTRNRLLEVTLALRSYQLGNGHPPDRLQQLVPGLLTQLPADPFAPSGTFHYQRQGDTYLLYSIGPDGQDDHGKPIVDSVMPDSRGDIVAGTTE